MHDCRQSELSEMPDLETQRAARELQVTGDLNEGAQGHPIQRNGVPSAERIDVDAVAVEGRYHRKASEPALGRLGLSDER
jgi:hypothetical protein